MKKIHISLFSAIVLVIILAALYGNLTGKNDPLFDQGTKTTFYAETEVGKEPDIRAENYFSEEEYDLSKFTFGHGTGRVYNCIQAVLQAALRLCAVSFR